MKQRIQILIAFAFSFFNLEAQEIEISYDYSSVEKLIEILESDNLEEAEFQELMKLHGTKSYLKKLSTFFPGINESSFKESLNASVKGITLENEPYMIERIIPLIPLAKDLLKEVIEKKSELKESSISLLGQYSPERVNMDVKVYLVLGIVGGGWTFDDEPGTFYIDLTYLKGDYKGLTYLATHELYHLMQYQFMKQPPSKASNRALYLVDQMIREGSATYVADFSKVSESGFYIDFNKDDYNKNFRRMESNFALFESLITQADVNSKINIDLLYNIGLSGMYQSPLYFVGYHMIKIIDQYKGRQELINLLAQSPEKLILAYVELCNKYADEDDSIIELTDKSINILRTLN